MHQNLYFMLASRLAIFGNILDKKHCYQIVDFDHERDLKSTYIVKNY